MKKKKLSLDQIEVKSFITKLEDHKAKLAISGNGGGDDSKVDNGCKGDKGEFTDNCKDISHGSWCIIECFAPMTDECSDVGTLA